MKYPTKPKEPLAPSPFIRVKKEIEIHSNIKVSELVNMLPENFDLNNAVVDGSWCNECPYMELRYCTEEVNPEFDQQLEKYKKDIAKYEYDLIIHRDNLKEYNRLKMEELEDRLKKLKENETPSNS